MSGWDCLFIYACCLLLRATVFLWAQRRFRGTIPGRVRRSALGNTPSACLTPEPCTTMPRKSLQTLFLREVLAAGVGIKASTHSLDALSTLSSEMRYDEFRDNLRAYFEALRPFRRFGDFQGLAMFAGPSPLSLYVEPHILHGHFRAWLRSRRSGSSGRR